MRIRTIITSVLCVFLVLAVSTAADAKKKKTDYTKHPGYVSFESLDAFASPETGPLGVVDRGQVIFFSPPHESSLPKIDVEKLDARVDLIRAYPGGDGRFVEASLEFGNAC